MSFTLPYNTFYFRILLDVSDILNSQKRYSPKTSPFLNEVRSVAPGYRAASTQNVALSALLFLYPQVLRGNLPDPDIENIERARRSRRVPVVLTHLKREFSFSLSVAAFPTPPYSAAGNKPNC